ncbi:MAG: hypothetical protein R2788_10685 [Saprospiraceae bacterium]
MVSTQAAAARAEQLFLRGFDIDHGIGVSISVDGISVNAGLPCHGQGYADLHFLIPETVERLDFGKGLYYTWSMGISPRQGMCFPDQRKTGQQPVRSENMASSTPASWGFFDFAGKCGKPKPYIILEYLLTDGPFESPQNFSGLIVGQIHGQLG